MPYGVTLSQSHVTTFVNCLLYARVSTDKQAQKELSIPAQITAMREHARRNGWKIVDQFVDSGESARTINRPELKRLIAHCKEHQGIDLVLVHKIDRLARNLVDFATIKAILKQKGIRLVSVSEPFDDNSIGHLLENIIASISEWYSANLGDEIRKANVAKLRQGEWPHKPPIGYKSVKGVSNRVMHVPDEKTGPLIRQAFELFASGHYSLTALSEEMFIRGLATRAGRMYSAENIKRIFSRQFYTGRIVWQEKVYPGKHAPLVPRELFDRVQKVLKRRSADTGEKGSRQFLLRGVARCAVCGQRLTGEVHPRGMYYRCVARLDQKRCDQPYPPVASLDAQVARLYEALRLPPDFIELLRAEVQQIVNRRKRMAERELDPLKRAVQEIDQKEIRLVDEMLAGTVDRQVYEKLAKSYREKRQQAEARLAQLGVDYDDPTEFLDGCAKVASLLAKLHRQFGFDQQKDLLRAVFARIDVQDRTIVNAQFNPPFSFFFDDLAPAYFKQTPPGIRGGTNDPGSEPTTVHTELGATASRGFKDSDIDGLLSFTSSGDMQPLKKAIAQWTSPLQKGDPQAA